jgi:SOS response regulatory protein OraA/RecX
MSESAMPDALSPEGLKAYETALGLLRSRDRFQADLERRLRTRGYLDCHIVEAVQRLRSKGVLDDRRTLRQALEAYRRRGLGVARIRDELVQRGAVEDLVDAALADWSQADEIGIARAVLREKRGPCGSHGRAWRLLASRGFAEDVAGAAIQAELVPEIEAPED